MPARGSGHGYYGGGYYGGGYYPPYYPYYPYYSWGGYYSPWWSAGLWWGWPGYWYDGPWYGGYPVVYSGAPSEIPGSAFVETQVRPSKAQVFLDGEPIGEARDFNGTGDSLELASGRHVFRFEAPGYMALEVGVDTRRGEHYRLVYDLAEGEGKDPRSQSLPPTGGPPPRSAEPSQGAAGSVPPRNPSAEGDRTSVARGFLKVNVLPQDAAVYLDGEFLGRGDELKRLHGAIPVMTGTHRIEVVRPGYRGRVESVNVPAGPAPAEVVIELEREDG